jgi:hypothetical protein
MKYDIITSVHWTFHRLTFHRSPGRCPWSAHHTFSVPCFLWTGRVAISPGVPTGIQQGTIWHWMCNGVISISEKQHLHFTVWTESLSVTKILMLNIPVGICIHGIYFNSSSERKSVRTNQKCWVWLISSLRNWNTYLVTNINFSF